MEYILFIFAAVVFLTILVLGIKRLSPTQRGVVERLGKYTRFAKPGFHWIVPIMEKMYKVNTAESMIDSETQVIITNDNLNAEVDAQVYFKVKTDVESVKNSVYNVNNYMFQIVNLTKTTLKNIIGTMTLKSANSKKSKINAGFLKTLLEKTQTWGIEIVRTELNEKDTTSDVQETVKKFVNTENEKDAGSEKRVKLNEAEDYRQPNTNNTEDDVASNKLVSEAADGHIVVNAQQQGKSSALESSLSDNTNNNIPTSSELDDIIEEMAHKVPLK